MNPTLLSDPDNSRKPHDAFVALTDNGEDTEYEAEHHNFWEAKPGKKEAHFVFDLGCADEIGEVRLRNSHTPAYRKKSV